MTAVALGLSIGSLAVVLVTLVHYFSKVVAGTITAKIAGLVARLVLGIALAAAAIAVAARDGSLGVATIAPPVVASMFAATILFFLSQRKVPLGELAVGVGDKLLPFAATTSEGAAFDSADLDGTRVLLKFFRGGW